MGRVETLFDRKGELAEVAALIERSRAGDGGVLLIEGPMGIGKRSSMRPRAWPRMRSCCAAAVERSSAT